MVVVVVLTPFFTLIGSTSLVHSFSIHLLIFYSLPCNVLDSRDTKLDENNYSSGAQCLLFNGINHLYFLTLSFPMQIHIIKLFNICNVWPLNICQGNKGDICKNKTKTKILETHTSLRMFIKFSHIFIMFYPEIPGSVF